MDERGREFFKMCGSGNDFVFFDAREDRLVELASPEAIRSICSRGMGVGADGVVFLEASSVAAIRMRYYNSDGSRASLCGNATLCTTRLAVELGAAPADGFTIETDAGVMAARMRDGQPEIDLAPVKELVPSAPVSAESQEHRIGFAVAGVPHLVVRVDDVEQVELGPRGRRLRFDSALPDGANVNFVSPAAGGHAWRMRTYERGVEGETLACGTGAVACAAVLASWGESSGPTTILTRSGRALIVRPGSERQGPSLAGEGRIVFSGELREVL